MTTASATTGFATSGHVAQGVVRALAAAVVAAMARARARRDYRRLLECDEILRDVGVSRGDVRAAMGRA